MIRCRFWVPVVLMALRAIPVFAGSDESQLVQRQWFLTRTAHFNIYSCGPLSETYKLAARLEQFCDAYSILAGTNAVSSPPVVVMAFPDHESMQPFLPLYRGEPGNLSGFFTRGSDENLIVLALPGADSASSGMDVIFHEYAHLLFRRNDRIWPLWLKEGMAEIYSTFETTGDEVQIARPIAHHLHLLAHEPLMPLHELFAVTPQSAQYNESTRQGIFYAESWLLTDYLMAGDNPDYRARFGQFTEFLREGQLPEQAFTNALGTTLPMMEMQLRRYLERGQFVPITLTLPDDLPSSVAVNTQVIAPVETYFRFGDELLRIDRLDAAESYFVRGQKLAPVSPLPYEGLGLLAAQRGQHEEALRDLKESLQLGSTSFLAYYVYAQEKYRLTADAQNRYSPLSGKEAAEIGGELKKSIALMPSFGPAHELLGFIEVVQGKNLATAEQQLQLAIQLEPENSSYLLTLAQAQLRGQTPTAARRTLEPLLLPNADAKLRVTAEEMIQEISQKR
jgi:tetratricopeptide (TPR) repeat protein